MRHLLAALTLLALAACSEATCVEKDVAVAERAFTACVTSAAGWLPAATEACRKAADDVSCKRREHR